MKINTLLKTNLNIDVGKIKTSSKDIKKGDVFVCALGNIDKHKYIDDAIKRGCSLVVGNKNINKPIPYIKVNNIDNTISKMLDRYYNYPLLSTNLIGVTGTDGKTTVASIVRCILNGASIGTNGLEWNNYQEKLDNTTPSLDKIYDCFSKIKKNNIKDIIMEVSSESYLTNRIPNLKFDIGIFTNITDEHLDKHSDFNNYFECKMQLLKNSKISIINRDCKYFKRIVKYTNNYLTYGYKKSTLTIKKYKLFLDKTIIWFIYQKKVYRIESPLLGEFNVYNLMAGILTLLALKYDINDIISRIKLIEKISGRMEVFKKNDKMIMIDYAHTINATKKVLEFVKKYSSKNIITVVGCAGGRYKEKRSIIGRIVLKYSKLVIFTSDDPRWENPLDIIDDMIGKSRKKNYYRIVNRKEALELAIKIASKDDIILVLGKGRDSYMAINDQYLPYSDVMVINSFLDMIN